MATDNFGTQGFDDDEVSGKELGEDRKRNLDGVEWTYGAGGVGGVDLGSRGVTDEVGGNYTAPKYEYAPEKGTIGLKGWLIFGTIVVALLASLSFWVVNTSQAPDRDREAMTAVVDEFYQLSSASSLERAAELFCTPDKDAAYKALLSAERVEGSGEAVFTFVGTTVIDALPVPKTSSFGKKKDPTNYDVIANPEYQQWGIVTGFIVNEQGQSEYVSYHIASGASGKCIAVSGKAVNDFGTIADSGVTDPKEARSKLVATNQSSDGFLK